MDRCFDKWAGLLIRFSKSVCLAFLIIYILIGKFLLIKHQVLLGLNIKKYEEFEEPMQIWTPYVSYLILSKIS